MSQEDFNFTEETIKQIKEEKGFSIKIDNPIKGIVRCPACEKIFISSERRIHNWLELNRRSRTAKPNLKEKDGNTVECSRINLKKYKKSLKLQEPSYEA